MTFTDTLTLREARQRYFDHNGFGDGGYNDKWVKLKLGPIPFGFPNTKARKRAVRLHDLHHVVTGYPTTWTGEAEIGAWEIASGCGDYAAAWVLNFWAFTWGLVTAPKVVYRAFLRGRHSSSLYNAGFHEGLLDKTVGQARRDLLLDRAVSPVFADRLAFAAWAGSAALLAAVLIAAVGALLLR